MSCMPFILGSNQFYVISVSGSANMHFNICPSISSSCHVLHVAEALVLTQALTLGIGNKGNLL